MVGCAVPTLPTTAPVVLNPLRWRFGSAELLGVDDDGREVPIPALAWLLETVVGDVTVMIPRSDVAALVDILRGYMGPTIEIAAAIPEGL